MSLVEYSIVSKIGSEVNVVNTISGGSFNALFKHFTI